MAHHDTVNPHLISDLAELLRTLCRVPGAAATALVGTPRPSEISEHFFHIEPTRFPAFRAIEMRPWSENEFGVALPELTDPANWSISDLADLLGPLQTCPRTPGEGPRLQGFLDDPALRARAAVYVILSGDDSSATIEEIRIRIELADQE